MRIALCLIAVLGLSGCISMDSITPSKREPADTSYYLLDTKYRFFCLGNTKQCRDMTKIVSSRAELIPIEKTYGQKIAGPNYPVSLARMVMNPADGSYTSSPVGSDGRIFKIPVNDKTKVVWETLSRIEDNLFN